MDLPLPSQIKNMRYTALDGLRGFAALQVVALHYVSSFIPSIFLPTNWQPNQTHLTVAQKWIAGTPLFYFIDGYSGVYVFFLLSGFVLTKAYSDHKVPMGANIASRAVRLLVPVWASLILALLCFIFFPNDISAAAALSQSAWLYHHAPDPLSLLAFIKDLLGSSLTGYEGFTVFNTMPGVKKALGLLSTDNSLNAPLWTLHFELYGSLMIMVLVSLRAKAHWLYWLAVIGFLLIAPASPLSHFIVGQLAFIFLKNYPVQPKTQKGFMLLGYLSLALGIVITSYKNSSILNIIGGWLSVHTWLASLSPFQFQSQIAAIFIFLGVLGIIPAASRLNVIAPILNGRFFQWIGKYSFTIYLVHLPILLTLGSFVYEMTAPQFGTSWAAFITIITSALFTLPVVIIFENLVNSPAITLSHRIKNQPAIVSVCTKIYLTTVMKLKSFRTKTIS